LLQPSLLKMLFELRIISTYIPLISFYLALSSNIHINKFRVFCCCSDGISPIFLTIEWGKVSKHETFGVFRQRWQRITRLMNLILLILSKMLIKSKFQHTNLFKTKQTFNKNKKFNGIRLTFIIRTYFFFTSFYWWYKTSRDKSSKKWAYKLKLL